MGLVKKVVLTAVLLVLAGWTIRYGFQQHIVESKEYADGDEKIPFARARYDKGLKALYENRHDDAGMYFKQAVSEKVFFIDAWLKLAEVQSVSGSISGAESILRFTDQLTRNVIKWKWPQIILALELGAEEIFLRNINFVIPYNEFRDDALQLTDIYIGNCAEVIRVLDAQNLVFYLQWLMKWKRTDDCFAVWNAMSSTQKKNDHLYEIYVDFLIRSREVKKAADTWVEFSGTEGITNPGFENPISNHGFGWRSLKDEGKNWVIEQVRENGENAVRISFLGKCNPDFGHFYQIVPVEPLQAYNLTYRWCSRNLTTDQRPFIEITAFEHNTLVLKSEMIPSSIGWRDELVEFSVPENCNAVIIRIRRSRSHRFDSKIEGIMWMDAFKLQRK